MFLREIKIIIAYLYLSHYVRKRESLLTEKCTQSSCKQCCQLSNFVAKFCNFFFQKHLATNVAIFKIYLPIFSNIW